MITSLDGKAITSADQLGTAIQADKPGQQVTIGLYRGQTQMTVTATLGSTPQEQQTPAAEPGPGRAGGGHGRRRCGLYARGDQRISPTTQKGRRHGHGDHRSMTTPRGGLRIEALAAPRPEPARDGSPPDEPALAQILETATTVPDHGGLRPWRFAVVTGPGRDRLGDALVAGLHSLRGAGPARGGGGQDAGEGLRRPLHGGADRLAGPVVQRAGVGTGGLGVVHRLRHGAGGHRPRPRGGVEERRGAGHRAGAGPVRAHRARAAARVGQHRGPRTRRRSRRSRRRAAGLSELVTVIDDGEHPFGTPPTR